MRTFPSEEVLVAAYWRRLARSIDRAGAGKRQKRSASESRVRPGVRQQFAGSDNVKSAVAARGARSPRMRSDRTTNERPTRTSAISDLLEPKG
jgi:hypothetical protein